MNLPAPKAVIFDWDNTLVDTWPVIHRALHDTFTEIGLPPWTLEQTKARVRKSMRDSFPEIFGPRWQQAGEMYQRHYRAHHLGMLTPLPGAEEVLQALGARGVPALVVSNKRGQNLRQEISHLGWQGLFASTVGADDAARDKPHPDPVYLALSHLDMQAGPEIWFVGDSEVDLEAAAAAGCTAILFGDYAPAQPSFTPTHYAGFPYAWHVGDMGGFQRIIML